MPAEYSVEIPGLAEAVQRCAPAPGHRELLKRLRRIEGLSGLELATTRGEGAGHYLSQRKVLTADGAIVHEDHRAWMAERFVANAGDVEATYRRLRAANYRLSRCDLVTLYFTLDRHTEDAADFLELEVRVEDERANCEALQAWPFTTPRTLKDLIDIMEGAELAQAERVRVRAPAYRLQRLVDIGRFVHLAETVQRGQRAQLAKGRYLTTDPTTGESTTMRLAELDPDFDRYSSKPRRFFDDWQASSAGRSGARLCAHWVMQLSDWTDPRDGKRDLGFIPVWTFGQKLAEVDASKGDVYAFFGKLQTLDRRVKVPFGWYFYMLHGNRVHDSAGRRALKAAEDGLIVMPEHDYQVLRAWNARPYSF